MESTPGVHAWCWVGLLAVVLHSSAAEGLSPAEQEFFENQVRPVLAEGCYGCHSAREGKVKGGLELDWKGGWQQGGDSGTVILPGNADESRLIQAIRYADPDLQMPPKGEKLSDAQIRILERWVGMGAPDPRERKPEADESGGKSGASHWAFQPIRDPKPPEVINVSWPRNGIDRFILAKLEEHEMAPSATADRRTLIRRAYFDLVGLPPTMEEVRQFVEDDSPDAWEKVVDTLLASPHYGERWGRHWLDVARYSDTKGQINPNRDTSFYPYAWTYRDYVIRAFNDDKPYTQFILEQLAADQLPAAETDPATLAALGFLTVGDRFNGMVHDIINDRIDVTTKAFLGMTVSCTRCHDHMSDPVTTQDYYALHGIFNSADEPKDLPVIVEMGSVEDRDAYEAKRKGLEVELNALMELMTQEVFGDYRRDSARYLHALLLPTQEQGEYLNDHGVDASLLANWRRLVGLGARPEYKVFTLFNSLARLSDEQFAQRAPRLFQTLPRRAQAGNLHPSVVAMLTKLQPGTKSELAVAYGDLISGNDEAFNQTMHALVSDGATRFVRGRKRNQYRTLTGQMAALEMTHPGAPGRAMILTDAARPKDSPVFIRGDANNVGETVPRRFLEILGGSSKDPFKNGSGRLELAQAIADESNPLTARVMVNRVWQHHFGTGFVDTPDDLGRQAEEPSHPELLDYLSKRFVESGWSVKSLHREILLSATWQQSSQGNPRQATIDPYNRLLWRSNLRRLEFEPLRDSILLMGGDLDLSLGGKPVDLSEGTHKSRAGTRSLRSAEFGLSPAHRRSIYGFVDRADVMEMMNIFDFASPDMPTGRRYETTVPQQALFLMNSPLVVEQARNMVQRPEFLAMESVEQRIGFLYALVFQREPSSEELTLGTGFVMHPNSLERDESASRPNQTPLKKGRDVSRPETTMDVWAEYAHALLLTDEACFVN